MFCFRSIANVVSEEIINPKRLVSTVTSIPVRYLCNVLRTNPIHNN